MIPKEFVNTLKTSTRFNLIKYEATQHWREEDYVNGREEIFDFEVNEETQNTFISDIETFFNEEYNNHVNEKLYFIGCPFLIYQSTYNDRLKEYLKENELDLYNKSHFVKQEMLDTLLFETSPYVSSETNYKLKKSISRRKEFLKTELSSLGYKFKVSLNKIGDINSVAVKVNSIEEKEEVNNDLSDSKDVDKIRILELIGFFDFIKKSEPNLNVNQIATLLSSITGITQSTIQSYINPILSDSSPNKNPLKNKKKVEVLRNTLLNIGLEKLKQIR